MGGEGGVRACVVSEEVSEFHAREVVPTEDFSTSIEVMGSNFSAERDRH